MPRAEDGRTWRNGTPPSRRRTLRREETDAERALWLLLRSRRLGGAKFRRQHAAGPYILDFYCAQARLAIEVDGSQHYTPDGAAGDATRTAYLEAFGARVLRFSNRDVPTNADGVLEAILHALRG
jgi:very-short-patch-repair endonuclease